LDLTHASGDIAVFRSTKFLKVLSLASTQVFGDIKVGKMGAIAIDEPFFVQLSDKNRFRIVATQQKWSRIINGIHFHFYWDVSRETGC